MSNMSFRSPTRIIYCVMLQLHQQPLFRYNNRYFCQVNVNHVLITSQPHVKHVDQLKTWISQGVSSAELLYIPPKKLQPKHLLFWHGTPAILPPKQTELQLFSSHPSHGRHIVPSKVSGHQLKWLVSPIPTIPHSISIASQDGSPISFSSLPCQQMEKQFEL